jgi:hypothetical protein
MRWSRTARAVIQQTLDVVCHTGTRVACGHEHPVLDEYDHVVAELDRIAAEGNGAMRQLRAWQKRGEVMDVIAEAAVATLS